LIFPPVHLCTDNAAMIAYVGLDRLRRGVVDKSSALLFRPKWYAMHGVSVKHDLSAVLQVY
jgi:tRNA A37 threonylcarbamoyltransferase TsaD